MRVALFAPIQGVTISDPLDQLCINMVRFLSVDTLQQANSGHPSMPLGAAAMAYVMSEGTKIKPKQTKSKAPLERAGKCSQ